MTCENLQAKLRLKLDLAKIYSCEQSTDQPTNHVATSTAIWIGYTLLSVNFP